MDKKSHARKRNWTLFCLGGARGTLRTTARQLLLFGPEYAKAAGAVRVAIRALNNAEDVIRADTYTKAAKDA